MADAALKSPEITMASVKKKACIIVVLAASMYVVIYLSLVLSWHFHSDRKLMIRAIKNNEAVSLAVGKVEDMEVRRHVSFLGSRKRPAYEDFEILVQGKRGSLRVSVRLTGPPDDRSVLVTAER